MALSKNPPICTICTPIGMLGYGFNFRQIDEELSQHRHDHIPTAIILDSGSTDSGPLKLATGSMSVPRSNYTRDLAKLLKLVIKHHVPLVIGSAGGDGSNAHVDELVKIVQELFAITDSPRPLKVLAIHSEINKDLVLQRLKDDKIQGCGSAVPELTIESVHSTPRIVAQMGPEPFLDAMSAHPDFDILIGGRAYDPAPYVAYAMSCYMKAHKSDASSIDGPTLGNFYHMGQIMECGGACATPKSSAAVATIYADSFTVHPLQAGAKCTPLSVAAHTLYEKSRPDLLLGPGGYLDLTHAKYEQVIDMKTVSVRGAVFKRGRISDGKYTVKLEGASVSGYRTLFLGSFGDPILTSQLDDFLYRVQVYVQQQHHDVQENWKLHLHHYGETPAQVCIIGEALADTQMLASSVASTARIACVHGPYPGQKATSGNFAFGIGGPSELETGPCAVFCVYHLMELETGEERGLPMDSTKGLFKWKEINLEVSPGHAHSDLLAVAKSSEPPKTPIPQYAPPPITFDTLSGIAQVIRSKNAGPFEITIDVLFEHDWCYKLVKESNLLNEDTICDLFAIDNEDLIFAGFFDQAKAFKVTFPRRREGKLVPSGGFMENDVHGSQRYRPLLGLEIPVTLRGRLEAAYLASKQTSDGDVHDEVDETLNGSHGIPGLQINGSKTIPDVQVNGQAKIPST